MSEWPTSPPVMTPVISTTAILLSVPACSRTASSRFRPKSAATWLCEATLATLWTMMLPRPTSTINPNNTNEKIFQPEPLLRGAGAA